MARLDAGGIRNLLGAIRGEKFRAPIKPYREWRTKLRRAEPSKRVVVDTSTMSDAPVAPLGEYYVCQRRAEGYPSFCKACQARCSRVAFEKYRDRVVANLEKYCQGRPAPSARHRAAQIAGDQRYWAHRRGAIPTEDGLTTAEWKAILELYGGRCAYCGSQGATQDHVVPVSRGGAHTANNVVPSCRPCNSRKGAKVVMTKRQFLLPL